jgi:capsular polysaccharide biosynthesis protein
MNNLPLFIAGFLVSCVVFLAIGILIYAAILDGRYEREQQVERATEGA